MIYLIKNLTSCFYFAALIYEVEQKKKKIGRGKREQELVWLLASMKW